VVLGVGISVVENGPIVTRCSHLTFSPNSSTHPLTEIECLSMPDVPGEFMITSGSRPFRVRPVRSVLTHFFTGSLHEIDSSIRQLQHLLSIFPRSNPLRLQLMFSLASKRHLRYSLLDQREDLDKSIVHLTEFILLSPLSRLQRGPNILSALFALANSLFLRSTESKQPEDAICATKYLSHLRDQPHAIPSFPRHKVTDFLVRALAWQVELKAGNVMQNIREMAVLSRELLETSDVDATHLIVLIHAAMTSKIRPVVPGQPLDELIEFSRAARKCRPDLLKGHMTLVNSLVCRYFMTGVNDDYEEAASILDDIIAYRSLGNTQDESVAEARAWATGFVTTLSMLRSAFYESPENLEEEIYRNRACASSYSHKEHSQVPLFVMDPEATAKKRFRHFGSIEGVADSSGNSSLAGMSSESQEKFQTINRMQDLLFGIRNTDDTTEIDEAIEEARSILGSSPDRPFLIYFSDLLHEAFNRAKKIEYLNESISIRHQLIESPLPQALRFMILSNLPQSLLARSLLFPGYRTQDLDEALERLSQFVSDAHASVPDRFRLACDWAFHARRTRHSSVSTAYVTALSLMQDTVLFSPTLQLQHSTLATHDITQSLSLDYASYLVHQHQLEEAIDVLERGRALLWSEMRHLRTSIDQLLSADPVLGHKFAAVNRDLEQLTKSIPPSHKLSMDDGTADGLRAVDPFGRLVLKQRGLLNDRAKLISQIQALPGFDSFLTSPPFDTLRSAASSGPVIIINHSKWRSDILILLHNKPPSLIPTPDDFFKRAGALKDKLLDSRRKSGLDSRHYEETLAFVLDQLYELVGKPVIDRLRQLQVPEQSRIWWCPTSVLCTLPLHAMGPIPSDDGKPRYFLDLYICSYTPTLSALIQSRRRDSNLRSSQRPSMLLVAQPDPSLPTVGGEIQAVQALDTEVTSLISEAATPDTVIDGFHHHGFVHFACHGTLETGKPFEAGFELHGDARLTLLEIVRANLPAAEFAFLSACHTAEMTEGSVVEEGLHLAAAVQYCGFRSVVGTMWAMVDEDGRDLAKNFYKVLLRRDQGVPYHEKSAEALQYAVKRLRRKGRITLERWVNFVHYGA
jgi:CHAT domain-containing protein/tetratricopeptide (TPR) repeat protein